MKRPILHYISPRAIPGNGVQDVLESITGLFQDEGHFVQTPIILDVDLVDLLLVRINGQLCVIKVVGSENFAFDIGKFVADYGVINAKREKFKRAYPQEPIDIQRPVQVKLFVPFEKSALRDAFSYVTIPLEVFLYTFVSREGDIGLLIDRVPVQVPAPSTQNLASFVQIMGENVRSENSPAPPGLYAGDGVLSGTPAAGGMETAVKNEDAAKQNIFERGKLSEAELLSFFEFEKKIDEHRNNPYK